MRFLTYTNSCLFALMVLLASCGGEEGPSGPKYNYERADSLSVDYLKELGTVRTNIELTAKLFGLLKDNDYAFSDGLMLSASKSSGYSGSKGQSLGLGGFGSDIVYATIYGQNQAALDRTKGLMDLSGKLNITEAFDKKFIDQLTSEDSTINKPIILTKAYLNAKDQLFSDERAQLATFMVVGGWVEGVYIGSGALKTKLEDQNIKLSFWELTNSYENVLKMMAVFEGQNPDIAALKKDMEGIRSHIEFIEKNPTKYTTNHVTELHDAISSIRSKVL